MEPLVYIILVNYNGFSDTLECIESIRNITYKNYKIIVVDNKSTDEPEKEQLLFLRANTIYIQSESNLGFSGGNNIGIRYAKENNADYVLLLNNDTTVEPDFLTKLVVAAKEKEDKGVFGCKIKYYWNKEQIWFDGGTFDFKTANTSHYHTRVSNGTIEEVTFLTGCLMLIPMEVLNDVGMLDETYFLYAEDTDYCCRVMDASYKLYYCPDAVIYHKEGASTGKTSELKQYYVERNGLYICRMYSAYPLKACLKRAFITWKSVFRRRLSFKPIMNAYIDFVRNKRGEWKNQ